MSRAAGSRPGLAPARAARLERLLDGLSARTDAAVRIGFDPVEFPRRYDDPGDAEVAGLIASCFAYGRADVFKPVVERILAAMGRARRGSRSASPRPRSAARSTFAVYRFNRPADVRALVAAIGHVRRLHGSLGARFTALFRGGGGRAGGAARSARALRARSFAGRRRSRRCCEGAARAGCATCSRTPAGPGASKRWNLYLRWMVRGPDAVDLGLWRGVPASALRGPARHARAPRRRASSGSPAGATRAGAPPRR